MWVTNSQIFMNVTNTSSMPIEVNYGKSTFKKCLMTD